MGILVKGYQAGGVGFSKQERADAIRKVYNRKAYSIPTEVKGSFQKEKAMFKEALINYAKKQNINLTSSLINEPDILEEDIGVIGGIKQESLPRLINQAFGVNVGLIEKLDLNEKSGDFYVNDYKQTRENFNKGIYLNQEGEAFTKDEVKGYDEYVKQDNTKHSSFSNYAKQLPRVKKEFVKSYMNDKFQDEFAKKDKSNFFSDPGVYADALDMATLIPAVAGSGGVSGVMGLTASGLRYYDDYNELNSTSNLFKDIGYSTLSFLPFASYARSAKTLAKAPRLAAKAVKAFTNPSTKLLRNTVRAESKVLKYLEKPIVKNGVKGAFAVNYATEAYPSMAGVRDNYGIITDANSTGEEKMEAARNIASLAQTIIQVGSTAVRHRGAITKPSKYIHSEGKKLVMKVKNKKKTNQEPTKNKEGDATKSEATTEKQAYKERVRRFPITSLHALNETYSPDPTNINVQPITQQSTKNTTYNIGSREETASMFDSSHKGRRKEIISDGQGNYIAVGHLFDKKGESGSGSIYKMDVNNLTDQQYIKDAISDGKLDNSTYGISVYEDKEKYNQYNNMYSNMKKTGKHIDERTTKVGGRQSGGLINNLVKGSQKGSYIDWSNINYKHPVNPNPADEYIIDESNTSPIRLAAYTLPQKEVEMQQLKRTDQKIKYIDGSKPRSEDEPTIVTKSTNDTSSKLYNTPNKDNALLRDTALYTGSYVLDKLMGDKRKDIIEAAHDRDYNVERTPYVYNPLFIDAPKGMSFEEKANLKKVYDQNTKKNVTSDIRLNTVSDRLADVGKSTYIGGVNMKDSEMVRADRLRNTNMLQKEIQRKEIIDNKNIDLSNNTKLTDAQMKAKSDQLYDQALYNLESEGVNERQTFIKGIRDMIHTSNNSYLNKESSYDVMNKAYSRLDVPSQERAMALRKTSEDKSLPEEARITAQQDLMKLLNLAV